MVQLGLVDGGGGASPGADYGQNNWTIGRPVF